MNRFFWWLAIGFFCTAPFLGAYWIVQDPVTTCPLFSLVAGLATVLAWDIYRTERNTR
jgi:hypothetical protein